MGHPASKSAAYPRPAKRKKENKMRARQTKAASAGLEDFMDWTGVIFSEPTKEEEMSSLTVGFATQMCKQAAGSKGKTTPRSDGKWLKRSFQMKRLRRIGQ